jgi:hypothetical protein
MSEAGEVTALDGIVIDGRPSRQTFGDHLPVIAQILLKDIRPTV